MALDTTTLHDALKTAFIEQNTITSDPEGAADTLAGNITDALLAFIEGLQITYTAGLATASGGGAVTGTFTYTLS